MIKLKWKVAPAPTGMYRSFHERGWPSASYNDSAETPAAMLLCDQSYHPADVKSCNHGEITIKIADHSVGVHWKWRTLKRRAKTLAEAKELAADFLTRNPQYGPQK